MSRFAKIDAELSKPARNCILCDELDQMDPEDAEYVRAMLTQPVKAKGHLHIAKVLEQGGVRVSDTTVATCRKRHQQQAA